MFIFCQIKRLSPGCVDHRDICELKNAHENIRFVVVSFSMKKSLLGDVEMYGDLGSNQSLNKRE